MQADIFDETIYEGSTRVGIEVIDNDGVEHKLSLDPSGTVHIHDQDAYPNRAADQSPNEAVRLEQVQAYAKYYLLQEKGYQTLEPRLTPAWLAYALGSVFQLDTDGFEHHFGAYSRQYHSQLRPEIDPVVELPREEAGGGIVFRADVFLGLDFEAYLTEPETMAPFDAVDGILDEYDLYAALGEQVENRLEADADAVEAVSELDVLYQTRSSTGSVEERTVGERTHSQDRPADAQLQMTPPQASLSADLTTEILQGLVLHHLTCQVRDAHLRLGIEPPEPFRVLGQGLYEQTIRYQHADVYPPYHRTDAEIEGYRSPGIETKGIAGGAALRPEPTRSLTELVKRALFGG